MKIMSKIENEYNLKKSDSDQSHLSTLLVQRYEELISTLYDPGIFKGLGKFLMMSIPLFVLYNFFWNVVICLPNYIVQGIGQGIGSCFMRLFGMEYFRRTNPDLALVCGIFSVFLEVGYSFFLLRQITKKISKKPKWIIFFYQCSLIRTKNLLYIFPTMVVFISFLIILSCFEKTNLDPKINLPVSLTMIFIPFIFICLSFWIYKPLFLTNGAAKISSSLRKELIRDLDEIPKSLLHSSWTHSFFYLLSKTAIFFLSSIPLAFLIDFILDFCFRDIFILDFNFNFLLFKIFCVICLVFSFPFLIHRYYLKGIVMFIHKISCARMITFPISFHYSILGGFYKCVVLEGCFITVFEEDTLWNVIVFLALHTVLHCAMVKVYRKALANKAIR
ncbi:hypothetical protein [Holospora undulata]|nr:hypothetical protein [Holospora undulata]